MLNTIKAFCQHYQRQDYTQALALITQSLERRPDDLELYWYQCCCLMKLGREDELRRGIRAKCQAVAGLPPASWLNQNGSPYPLNDKTLFLATLPVMPEDICQFFLSLHPEKQNTVKTLAIFSELIARDPESVSLTLQRARFYESIAHQPVDSIPEDAIVDSSGQHYSRFWLEAALQDYEKAFFLDGGTLHHQIRCVHILHLLARHEEVVYLLDNLLSTIPEDSPYRKTLLHMRRYSARKSRAGNQQIAELLAAFSDSQPESTEPRDLEEDLSHAVVRSMEESLREGGSLDEAYSAYLTGSKLDLLALNIARQILFIAQEPAPDLTQVNLSTFPAYQKQFIDSAAQQLKRAGYHHIATVEARRFTAIFGQRIALGIFIRNAEDIATVYAAKPKWPGLMGYVSMQLAGKWQIRKTVEICTELNSGHFIQTRVLSQEDPFDYGPSFHIEAYPPEKDLCDIAKHHERKIQHFLGKYRGLKVIRTRTLAEVKRAWQRVAKRKGEHRRRVSYVTDAELKRLLEKDYRKMAPRVKQKIRLLTKNKA